MHALPSLPELGSRGAPAGRGANGGRRRAQVGSDTSADVGPAASADRVDDLCQTIGPWLMKSFRMFGDNRDLHRNHGVSLTAFFLSDRLRTMQGSTGSARSTQHGVGEGAEHSTRRNSLRSSEDDRGRRPAKVWRRQQKDDCATRPQKRTIRRSQPTGRLPQPVRFVD